MIGHQLLAACGLDAVLGDPRWVPHPVRLIGFVIHQFKNVTLRYVKSHMGRYAAGIILAVGLPALCFVCTWWVIHQAEQLHQYLGFATWVIFGYFTLAARDLADHAMNVYRALMGGSISEAQQSVSLIVGRDTATLAESEIVRATIETVAESTSDGVIAPLLYLALGGPPLAFAYKAINTLDSMIGHRTPDYRQLGWASARFDDLVNWVPARLTGVVLVLAAALRLGAGRQAWRIFLRDGKKHASPNSGWPEAAMAGALHVQLGGTNRYEGIPVERPTLGDGSVKLNSALIPLAVQLMAIASVLMLVLLLGLVGW